MPNGYTKTNKVGLNDNTFPGRGRLLCYLCDRKLVDHPILRPCPFPVVGGLGIEEARVARVGDQVRSRPVVPSRRK